MNVKDQGHVAVLKLIYEAEIRGLSTLVPQGDNRPFDLVITPDHKNFIRVQVKSTVGKNQHGLHNFMVSWGRGHLKAYTKAIIDVVACYVFDEDLWYFVPIEDLKELRSVTASRTNRYKTNINDWSVFNGPKL